MLWLERQMGGRCGGRFTDQVCLQNGQPLVEPAHVAFDTGIEHVSVQRLEQQHHGSQEQEQCRRVADADHHGKAIDQAGPGAQYGRSRSHRHPEQSMQQI